MRDRDCRDARLRGPFGLSGGGRGIDTVKAMADTCKSIAVTDFDGMGSHANALAQRRTCLVVLGMHRSGTSAVTRVLGILGAALPHHVMAAAPSNETGHWEPQKLVEFHEELLAELGSAWHDWTALDVARLTVQRREGVKRRIAEILNDEYGHASLMVVKDPRICRFVPLFVEALRDASITPEYVLVFRNPLEVAHSLERRDGVPRGEAGLLWLRHVLDVEAATRGNQRAVLSYNDLLMDWRGEIRRITLGTELWPNSTEGVAEEIDGFLTSAQRHHTLSNADLLCDSVMSGWIADIHNALYQLRRNPAPAEALAMFDRVRGELDRAAPIIDRVQRDLLARLDVARLASLSAVTQQVTAPMATDAQIEMEVTRLGTAPDDRVRPCHPLDTGHIEPRQPACNPVTAKFNDITQWLDDVQWLSPASHNCWERAMMQLRQACATFFRRTTIPKGGVRETSAPERPARPSRQTDRDES
jgi:hypothetical protein